MSNCSNPYCASEYTCNCIHVYSDGSPLEGSGTEEDPYIHQKPIYDCIKLSDGTILEQDNSGCVTLPSFLTCILDKDGNSLPLDADGCMIIPSSVMARFVIQDGYGEEYGIYDGDVLKILPDGDSGTINNIEKPFLVGNALYLPQLKVRNFDNSEVILAPIAATSIGQVDFTRDKSTNFSCSLTLTISQNSSPLAPVSGEFLEYKIFLQQGASTIPVASSLIWEPSSWVNQQQVTRTFKIQRSGLADIAVDVWDVVFEVVDNQLTPSRTVWADYLNLTSEWV